MNLFSNKTAKRIAVATVGCVILTLFLGWRGSLVSQQGERSELMRSMNAELGLSIELISSKLTQFESEVFNVVSAEYLQHTSHTPGVTGDLMDSEFSAVGILELKGKGFESSWWSVNPKAHESVSQELLRNLVPGWQNEIRQMDRRHFIRAMDLKQSPMMVFLSRIQLPNTQTSALAVAVVQGNALKLNSATLLESFLWDSKGFIWGYQNSAYIGASLKADPLVQASMSPSEIHQVKFSLNGHDRLGLLARIPDSNLYAGLSREITPISNIFASWWISLAIAFAGASLISLAALQWWESEKEVIEMPEIFVEKDEEPLPKPQPEERRTIIREDTVDLTMLDPAPMATAPTQESKPLPAPQTPLMAETPVAATSTVKETASVEAVVRRALMPFRGRLVSEAVEVRENMPAGLFVKAKPAQLQTALEEIIKNALDAMKETESKFLSIATGLENAMVRITVHDTGCGIPIDDRSKIFEPFFTSHPESARGLGLTVVKRMLELAGGEARVESEYGKGTAISLLIPAPGSELCTEVPTASASPTTAQPSAETTVPAALGLSENFLGDEDTSSDVMVMEPVREIADKFEIRKPIVRMFD